MDFDMSMQQGGESAGEGTTYAVQFRENSKCGPQAPAVIPSKSIWNVFFRDDDYSADIVVGGAHLQEPNPTVGTILV
jgi:hypothetical protein